MNKVISKVWTVPFDEYIIIICYVYVNSCSSSVNGLWKSFLYCDYGLLTSSSLHSTLILMSWAHMGYTILPFVWKELPYGVFWLKNDEKEVKSGLLLMAEMKRDLNYKSRDINLCQFKLK